MRRKRLLLPMLLRLAFITLVVVHETGGRGDGPNVVLVTSFTIQPALPSRPRICTQHPKRLASSAISSSPSSSFHEGPESTSRNLTGLAEWATKQGVVLGRGVSWFPSRSTFTTITSAAIHPYDDNEKEDWTLGMLENECDGGGWGRESDVADLTDDSTVLFIPRDIILNSRTIEQQLGGQTNKDKVPGWEEAIDYIKYRNCEEQIPHYCLWIKLLVEWEQGDQSQWHPWIQSLPQTFSNALSMDMVELDMLPPYAWSLAMLQRLHLKVFPDALKKMPTAVGSASTLHDTKLHQWALSVVFTRCWGVDESNDQNDSADGSSSNRSSHRTKHNNVCHIAPIGDMLNHAENATTILDYDLDGNCCFSFKRDVGGGGVDTTRSSSSRQLQRLRPLSLSYGRTTNPSRYLVLYGFVDVTQRYIFSQVLVTHPTPQHKELGYDVDRMTLDTLTGQLAQEVWDVTLYSILEQLPDIQQQFYDAAVSPQQDVKMIVQAFHDQYRLETTLVLKKHVDSKVAELERLLTRMDEERRIFTTSAATVITSTGRENRSGDSTEYEMQHPCWGVIRQHNIFMYQSFAKAQRHLNEGIQREIEQGRHNVQ